MTESRNSENITPEDDISFDDVSFDVEAKVVEQEFISSNAVEQHAPLENAPAEFQQPGTLQVQPADQDGMTPNQMLQVAMEKNYSPEMLQQFMDLKQRYEEDEARKAYVLAMCEFKKNPPEIIKDHLVSYTTDKGTTEYYHAQLGKVVLAATESLAQHGFAHRWNIEQFDGGQIKVTCILTHALGHSESVSMQSDADKSGGKNNIQAKASTVSYLERYTLLAVSGLATMDMDDDGRGSEPQAEIPMITPDEVATLAAKLTVNKIPADSFNKWMKKTLGCEYLEELNANGLEQAHRRIDSAIRANKRAAE